ncbi:hypothetical protein H6P81_019454 [Aristolochia fimbriata]|uniref:DNA-3-methyladenine glycosylase I n=1 Tax=Aristolochia fimbriata TaxID=158543 RepID=A0AAV7DSM2_ARIFI|nr:hypothetical protein H6P81_019454 [Aristolochia fimbriata]
MCTTKVKAPQIDGRAVLQPACNRIPFPVPLKKKALAASPPPPPSRTPPPSNKGSPPISPKSKPLAKPGIKRGNDPNGLNSSAENPLTTRSPAAKAAPLVKKKSKKTNAAGLGVNETSPNCYSSSSLILEAPGSIAAARREQVNLLQAQRKMKIDHYGRTTAKLREKGVSVDSSAATTAQEGKRCSFITPNSDPLFVAYHDEEWGVPVHDDKLLFELLVLTGAQVGSDWTSILKKRNDFRAAFADFDVQVVANFNEKQIASVVAEYGMDLSKVRGAVDNANRILQLKKEFGSFEAYLWGFVNNKPIATHYKSCRKIPVKTSKSETMSKDMVRRGFRFVGPTVMHSFMQAAGLTNDHLVSCPRHGRCTELAPKAPPRCIETTGKA